AGHTAGVLVAVVPEAAVGRPPGRPGRVHLHRLGGPVPAHGAVAVGADLAAAVGAGGRPTRAPTDPARGVARADAGGRAAALAEPCARHQWLAAGGAGAARRGGIGVGLGP